MSLRKTLIFSDFDPSIYHCGDYGEEVPPVLIPNTEVKLFSAECTWLDTARETMTLPHPLKRLLTSGRFFLVFFCYIYLILWWYSFTYLLLYYLLNLAIEIKNNKVDDKNILLVLPFHDLLWLIIIFLFTLLFALIKKF